MLNEYSNKEIGNKDFDTEVVTPVAVPQKKDAKKKIRFNFPAQRMTIEAASLEEATQKLKTELSKSNKTK